MRPIVSTQAGFAAYERRNAPDLDAVVAEAEAARVAGASDHGAAHLLAHRLPAALVAEGRRLREVSEGGLLARGYACLLRLLLALSLPRGFCFALAFALALTGALGFLHRLDARRTIRRRFVVRRQRALRKPARPLPFVALLLARKPDRQLWLRPLPLERERLSRVRVEFGR